jgi:hypothetical protein
MLYSDEVWTGIEYQVAAHLIYEGLLEEGFSVVKGARDRYDGVPRKPIPRNPWNEIECGGHYARAMSSWSLLTALSGQEIDGPRGRVRFHPRHAPENFKCFFSGPEGWGSLAQKLETGVQKVEIAVKSGKLAVKYLQLQAVGNLNPGKVAASVGGNTRAVKFVAKAGLFEIDFVEKLMLTEGITLEVSLS